ncbi:MAG: TrmH family RNA methyltransferase [Patescibacteria group bacterium]|jgi:tRNA G18 (ribose-2'-O)-methylase SpoU|nr:TrmH family RNA methyltransferase [Patescibacteria group bacterium]
MQPEDTRNVIDIYKGLPLEAIVKDLAAKAQPIHIAIENYQHDFNIGSIVRTANAFNVSGVHIVGKKQWNKRGAMSTQKYLQLYHHKNIEDFYSWCNDNKLAIYGIDNIESSVPLHTIKFPRDLMMVYGQEGPGLSLEMQKICQQIVAIEQFGSTRSINVGAAAAITMYRYLQDNIL